MLVMRHGFDGMNIWICQRTLAFSEHDTECDSNRKRARSNEELWSVSPSKADSYTNCWCEVVGISAQHVDGGSGVEVEGRKEEWTEQSTTTRKSKRGFVVKFQCTVPKYIRLGICWVQLPTRGSTWCDTLDISGRYWHALWKSSSVSCLGELHM